MNRPLVFFETLYGDRGHMGMCVTEPDFLQKSSSGKNDQIVKSSPQTFFSDFLRKSFY